MIPLIPIIVIAGIGLTIYGNKDTLDKPCTSPCTTSVVGRTLIKHFEGFSPYTYIDAAGHPTIGYGHLIRDGEEFSEPISFETAEELLVNDLKESEHGVNTLVEIDLAQARFDALSSFTFNLGFGNLRSSTLLKKVNSEKHNDVPDQFKRWVYAGGNKLRGLELRRFAESELYDSVN